MIPFLLNVWKTWRTAPLVEVDDPWGYGASLEWATSCPPPRHNFDSIPRIRSERPAFDLHHPEATSAGVHDAQWADGRRPWSRRSARPTSRATPSSTRRRADPMRAMERIGILVGVFAFTMATIYGFWTASTTLGIEWVGVIGLILGGLLGFMIAWYLWMTRRRLERDPSDDPLGDIDEIQGEYGFFSPHSWWPLFLGAAAAASASSGWPSVGGCSSSAPSSRSRRSSAGPSSTGRARTRSEARGVESLRQLSAPAELVQGLLLDAEVVGDLVHHGHRDLLAQVLGVLAHAGQRAAEEGDPVRQ